LINVNLGHGHPKVVRAIQEQAERLCYVTPSFGEESRAELARLIAEVTPGDLTKTLFTTGGSEANEHALRIARMYTKRHKVLTQWRSFHGQTQGAATLGGDNRRWANEPGITGVVRFLNPDPYRSMFGNDAQKALAHVEEVLWYEGPEYVAANVLWAGLTYAGHPLACAAGVATIEAYREDGLIERGARSGELLMRELRAVAERHPSVGDVRGKGLFIGIELVKDRKTKEMLERAVRPEEVGEGPECGERADRDEKLQLDLRSRIERSDGAPREIDARR